MEGGREGGGEGEREGGGEGGRERGREGRREGGGEGGRVRCVHCMWQKITQRKCGTYNGLVSDTINYVLLSCYKCLGLHPLTHPLHTFLNFTKLSYVCMKNHVYSILAK